MGTIKKNYLIILFLKKILKHISNIKTNNIKRKSHVNISLEEIVFTLAILFILLPINIQNIKYGDTPIKVERINL